MVGALAVIVRPARYENPEAIREGEIVFGGLLDRFASLELLEAPSFRSSFTLRGLTSLNVACRSR